MKYAVGSLVLLVTTSVLAIAMANRNGSNYCTPCPCGGGSWPGGHPANTTKPKTVIVGGDSQKWNYGFNYALWAFNYTLQQSPFFVGDTLEFKYDKLHTVVLLPDFPSYVSCNLSKAIVIGKPDAGANGFKFTLQARNPFDPYFFACSAHGGIHCINGTMKFSVMPLPRW